MQDLRPGLDRPRMCGVDVLPRLDGEREVMKPRRVQLERLRLLCLTQPDRTGAGGREAQVVDLLAAFACDEERRFDRRRRIRLVRLESAARNAHLADRRAEAGLTGT